ncbi:MAG TPA: cyclic nucleotide-binding domain-containing protein [Terriglobales bacterium]|nr:cyclic nucleotide-binding domain-containing protein [Terriglobales bacterium]
MSSEFVRVRLSPEMENSLRAVMTPRQFSKGAKLYEQGASASGVFLIETGAVRVSLPTGGKQGQLLEIVGAGTILGLSDSMVGDQYRVTAEAEEPTIASFVSREGFLDFLSKHQDFCLQIIRLLSDNLHGLYHKFRSVSAHPGRPRRRSLDERLS